MKNFQKILKDFDFKTFLKFAGIGVVALIVLGLLLSLASFTMRTAFNFNSSYAPSYDKVYPSEENSVSNYKLSARNIGIPDDGSYIAGDDLEDFEVVEYSAFVRTAFLDKKCQEIESLKDKDYVVFENSNKGDRYCNFRFKVKKESEAEILDTIKEMKPEDLNINTEIIKKQIDDFTSEEEILSKRLEQVEETLEQAQEAYDEITELATDSKDVETLATIINDKISLIEKLTNERLDTKNRLDRIIRMKADQLERLDYSFFSVNISENLIIDFRQIKNSWEQELKNFVSDFNHMLQSLTIKLLSFGLILIQIAIYLILALLIGKYGWRFVKFVWKK